MMRTTNVYSLELTVDSTWFDKAAALVRRHDGQAKPSFNHESEAISLLREALAGAEYDNEEESDASLIARDDRSAA
ncbi:hypothetical protein [Ancylobacter oerskovii]|uniref:Uncharacterized protein n=1 Tax=Ancylobacter oerskovii TaxID=459519 RepID=A0ABW4Z4P5_9HYPH|nr:hypothetical protein [Ancylobacter oerskovii]MBS7543212.1 hypothetical protein [Ancylobacter oerskovii]